MAAASGNSALIQMQRLANQTQVQLQQMVNSANQLQTRYNSQEAQKARDWQTQMSKTAHQMEVEDLKKAGLNPVLSAGGNGAQSYTTSSASAQPESGANALAGVQSAQLSSIGNMESSRIQAAAQRAAAAQSAAAMRAAAATSAAAQKYAADVGYAKAKYQSDRAYQSATKVAKITSEASKWISQNKQASTPWGLFDKAASKVFKAMPTNINVSGFLNSAKSFVKKLDNNPSKYIANYSSATKNNFQLTSVGKSYANNVLAKMGISQTGANRKLVVQAYWSNSFSAYKTLLQKVPKTKIAATTRPGYR